MGAKSIKLNPIYMEEGLEELVNVIPTQTLTSILFRYSIDKLELTDEQLKALISDIDTLKSHNLWDEVAEQQTLKQCKKNIEDAEHYKRLSADDKAKYDAEFYKQFEM